MDLNTMKGNIGLGTKQSEQPSSLKLGVKPIGQPARGNPYAAPSNIKTPSRPSAQVKEIISSKELSSEYNGVLVSFLGNEGKVWMSEDARKAALDQAVTALKKKIEITKNEQVETGLGTALALSMQLAGGDVVGQAGASVAGDYYAEMSGWIDAAFDLASLGYKEDASRFFEHGMKNFPYDEHRGRCVAGYAMVHPDKAYAFLTSKLKGTSQDEIKSAIRMLGHLASSDKLDDATKTKCMELISGYSQGMMNASYYLDAIYALDVSNDQRAVPALKKFMKGMMVSDEQQRPALRSLALRYKDTEAIATLKSILNADMMATYDWRDKQYAFTVLLQAGDDAAYEYAKANLLKGGKGFFAAKDQPDLKPDIINALVRYADDRGVAAIVPSYDKYDDDDWIKTWSATAMMLLGEGAAMDLAARNIDKAGWEFTSVSIAQGLSMYGNYDGFKTLQRLVSLRQVPDGPGTQFMKMLAGSGNDVNAKKRELVSLRLKTAYALGQMNNVRSVPILESLLADESDDVRRSAANALTELNVPEAIPVMIKALDVNYGIIKGQNLDTTPAVHARLVRAAGNRWGKDSKVEPLMKKASKSKYASVRMISAAIQQ